MMIAEFLAAAISAVVELGAADTSVGNLAGAGVLRLHLAVADVIAVRVAQQHDVHGAEPRIVGAGDRLSGVVEDAHAGRVLEDRRAVALAEARPYASPAA